MRLAAATGLLALAGLASAGCGGAPIPSGVGSDVGANRVRQGAVMAFRAYIPRYQGHERAVVIDFRPAEPAEAAGLRLRYGATTGAGMSVGALGGWHPKKWELHPVSGFVIPRGKPWTIVVGMAADRPGKYLVHEWVLDYAVGSHVYRGHFGPTIGMCVDMPHSCRALAGAVD